MTQAPDPDTEPEVGEDEPDNRGPFRRFATSAVGIGILTLLVTSAVAYVMFQKDMLLTEFGPGDTVTARFEQDYRLRPYVTPIKVGGVKVGRVSSVERQPDGTALVEMVVDNGIPAKIGNAPRAEIKPTIILGGNYFLELFPGGDFTGEPFTGVIPPERTSVPVELDKIAATVQPDAVKGSRTAIRKLDDSLSQDGRPALKSLVGNAPSALGPSADVLTGLTGSRQGDLGRIVGGLDTTSFRLVRQPGQLNAIMSDLARTAQAFGNSGPEVGRALDILPETLDTADSGLRRLKTTLAKVRDTAEPIRPTVNKLDTLVDHATPVLDRTAPVLQDLRAVLKDARPLVEDLTPTSQRLKRVIDDVKGPVLDRVNGPILNTLNSEYTGTGVYAGTGGDGKKLYEELATTLTTVDRGSKTTDPNGAQLSLQPGFGCGSTPVPGMQLLNCASLIQALNGGGALSATSSLTNVLGQARGNR